MSDGVVAVARRALLPFVVVALLVGVVASFVGAHDLAVAVWSLASGVVAVDLVVVTIARLREGRVGVDVVALVALLASVVMGEALAGVVLALMVASLGARHLHYSGRWTSVEHGLVPAPRASSMSTTS